MKEIINIKTLILIVISLLSSTLQAQIVYVATDGTGDYNCDGTNDEIEINQALSYIDSQGGGTVHLKTGTYIIDNQINIYSNTNIYDFRQISAMWSSKEKPD